MDNKLLNTIVVPVAIIGGYYIVFFLVKLWAGTRKRKLPSLIQAHLHLPGLLIAISSAGDYIYEYLSTKLDPSLQQAISHALKILIIFTVAFFLTQVTRMMYDIIIEIRTRHDRGGYSLRSAKTKFFLIRRLLNIAIIAFGVIAVLMTFEKFKEFSTTILASAGMAGIVLGFAAQKSLGTLFSGIQIALAQPVRIDDIVVINNTYGTIGEITLTYIVVDTWDEKKLIVPIDYFLENSFENWTRQSPDIVGTARIYADYSLPVDELRKQFKAWLEETPLWDRRRSGMIVTEANDKAIVVRASMTAKNADDAFDLECLVREKMVTFVRENYPDSLPANRLKIDSGSHTLSAQHGRPEEKRAGT